MPTACAHNDLLLELVAFAHEEEPFARRWLPQLERGRVGLQVCAVYVDAVDLPELALRRALQQVNAFLRAVRENGDRVVHVRTRDDVEAVACGERLGLVLALEGAEPLGNDPTMIDVFWELGVRMVGLAWMRRNAYADGNLEAPEGGLSRIGCQLVDRLAALGCPLDLAHANDGTVRDVLARLPDEAPVLVSHADCRALAPGQRNVPDDVLRELGARGGLLGVMCHPFSLGAGAGLDDVCRHVEHAGEVAGWRAVGLGGDFTRQLARTGAVAAPRDVVLPPGQGLDDAVEGLAGPEDYPALAAALARRGLEPTRVEAVMGGNLLAFLRRALPA